MTSQCGSVDGNPKPPFASSKTIRICKAESLSVDSSIVVYMEYAFFHQWHLTRPSIAATSVSIDTCAPKALGPDTSVERTSCRLVVSHPQSRYVGKIAQMGIAAQCLAEHYRAACDLMNLFFVFDEYTDTVDEVEARRLADISMDALRNPEKPRPAEESLIGEVTRQ